MGISHPKKLGLITLDKIKAIITPIPTEMKLTKFVKINTLRTSSLNIFFSERPIK